MPVVALATTEMATVIDDGVTGYADTNVATLTDRMRELLGHPELARRLGQAGQRRARERFHIDRFVRDWNEAFHFVTAL
jgi:glycosyltransferase involved in cell wall biosynthesis